MVIGLPVQLSQSEASSPYLWRSMARTQLWCECFKGSGGDENKNKFEKLKANRSQSKERKFVPKCRRKNLLGVFAMMTWATTMPVLVGILKQFLRLLFLLREG